MNRRRVLTLIAAFACAPGLARAQTWRGRALGAEVSVTLDGPRAVVRAALDTIPALLEEAEALFSLYRDSALTRLNRDGRLIRPPESFRALMADCTAAHDLTGGLFDPTVQPLWRALAEGRDPAQARDLIGWQRVAIAPEAIRLAPGQQLTLNGIAQGWATDRVRAHLAALGFTRALVDIGEQAALGGPFRLGLADPVHGLVGHRTLTGGAIATSSPGTLRLGPGGHILHPAGRAPLWSTLSIEAASATMADALSTAGVFIDRARLARLRREAGLLRITAIDAEGDLVSL